MITLTLVLLVSTAGFVASFGRATRGVKFDLTRHLCLVAFATSILLRMLGWFGNPVWSWIDGVFVAALTLIYVGHAVAFRYWGAPLSRAVLWFAARNLRRLASTFPRQALSAATVLLLAFAAGTIAGWADLHEGSFFTRVTGWEIVLVPGVMMATFTILTPAGGRHLRSDPLIALFPVVFGDAELPPLDFVKLEAKTPSTLSLPVKRPATIVMIVVDSLRAKSLPFYGYSRATSPFLTSLIEARGARVVPVAISPCPSTESGVWSLLTSRRFRHLAVNSLGLHTKLRQCGCGTRFFLSGVHRGWMGLELLYGDDHDQFVDGISDAELVAQAQELPRKSARQTGELLYFHLMSIHSSSAVEKRFERWLPQRHRFDYLMNERWERDARTIEEICNYYDNSVLQVDSYIREIISTLESKGYLDDAVLIVTADHGEALGERPGVPMGHARSVFQESIQIPLLIMDTKYPLPPLAPMADLTDIAPTIADIVGIDQPSSWQGQSIFRRPFRDRTYVEFTTHPGMLPNGDRLHMESLLWTLHDRLYKVIWHSRQDEEIFRAAFDLSDDPSELRPLTDPSILTELETRRTRFSHESS